MRSTPARMLHNGQLIVDRYQVNKITAEPFRIPQNTVSVELANQMTGEQSTRNLRWDEILTTEEPLDVKIDDTAKITIELASLSDTQGSPVYKFHISDPAVGVSFARVGLSSVLVRCRTTQKPRTPSCAN